MLTKARGFGVFGLVIIYFAILSTATHAGVINRGTNGTVRVGSEAVGIGADTEADLRDGINLATRLGEKPRYLMVAAPTRRYYFSVYAQLVRTQHALIIRAYRRIYVFRIGAVSVTYSGVRQPLLPELFPAVSAPVIESTTATSLPQIEQRSQPYAAGRARAAVCPDCVMLLVNARHLQVSHLWSSKLDPWQVHPDYVFQKVQIAQRTRDYGVEPVCAQSNPNCYCNAATSTCYYPPGYGGSGGGSFGGGGGGTGSPPQSCANGQSTFSDNSSVTYDVAGRTATLGVYDTTSWGYGYGVTFEDQYNQVVSSKSGSGRSAQPMMTINAVSNTVNFNKTTFQVDVTDYTNSRMSYTATGGSSCTVA